jgi:DNA repair protein RecO (recombination protein O)
MVKEDLRRHDAPLRRASEAPHNSTMEWTDEAVILGARRHGESSVIVEAMTRGHGRHLGLVRGGRSRRMSALIQPGNGVTLTWRARLDDHLGQFAIEGTELRAGRFLDDAASLFGLGHLAGLLRLLPERDPHEGLYHALLVVLEHLDSPDVAAALMVRFELALLADLGFGLDLSACAVSGATQDLVFVSPKSGRAVSARAGEAYAARLLALPAFVSDRFMGDHVTSEQIAAGFALTGHFLRRNIYEPRGLVPPDERASFLAAVMGEERAGKPD